jgi:AcrR family transcriptional regulator
LSKFCQFKGHPEFTPLLRFILRALAQTNVQLLIAKTRTRNRAAREQALLVAASRLFASRGFEATTTREVAAEAGCAEGLIHRYFGGKAGLLLAIIQSRSTQEKLDRNQQLWSAPTLEDEILQLVEWEVDRMWDDREFLEVVIPRALVDPALADLVNRASSAPRIKAIAERLRASAECRALPQDELDALASFVATTGFMFGFMRPVVLRQDRAQARKMAATLARMMGRSLSALPASAPAYVAQPAVG